MSKASISFYPRMDKKNGKSGKVPLYLRIIVNRRKTETRLSVDVFPEQLPLWNAKVMRFEDPKMTLNRIITKFQQLFEELMYKNADRLQEVTPEELRDALVGTKTTAFNTVENYLNNYYLNTIEPKGTIDHTTKQKYRRAILHFNEFLAYKRKTALQLPQVDRTIVNAFIDYLMATIPVLKKIGMSEASAAGNVKKIKSIFQRANDEGTIPKNPFSGVRLNKKSQPREKLNSE